MSTATSNAPVYTGHTDFLVYGTVISIETEGNWRHVTVSTSCDNGVFPYTFSAHRKSPFYSLLTPTLIGKAVEVEWQPLKLVYPNWANEYDKIIRLRITHPAVVAKQPCGFSWSVVGTVDNLDKRIPGEYFGSVGWTVGSGKYTYSDWTDFSILPPFTTALQHITAGEHVRIGGVVWGPGMRFLATHLQVLGQVLEMTPAERDFPLQCVLMNREGELVFEGRWDWPPQPPLELLEFDL